MSGIQAVVSDFGGVLTSPLIESFAAFQDDHGIPLEAMGGAMAALAARGGAHPLFELEKGRITEADFLADLGGELSRMLGREVEMHTFTEAYWSRLTPNAEMIELLGDLRARGVRLALLTNNVREWEARWRAMLPVDELFEAVVDSAFVGMRKPDAEIYELTLARLGLPASACVFVDDLEPNVRAAEALGMTGVWFRSNAQAIREIEAAVGGRAGPG